MNVYFTLVLSLLLNCLRLMLGCIISINFMPVSVRKFLQCKYPRWGVAIERNVWKVFLVFWSRNGRLALSIIPPIECPTIINLIFLLEFYDNWVIYVSIYCADFCPISYNVRSICCEYDFSIKILLRGNIFFKLILILYMFPHDAWYPCASTNTFLNS